MLSQETSGTQSPKNFTFSTKNQKKSTGTPNNAENTTTASWIQILRKDHGVFKKILLYFLTLSKTMERKNGVNL